MNYTAEQQEAMKKYNLKKGGQKPYKQEIGETIFGKLIEFGFTSTKKHGTLEHLVIERADTGQKIKMWTSATLKNALELAGVAVWPSEDELINDENASVKLLVDGVIGILRGEKTPYEKDGKTYMINNFEVFVPENNQ